MRFLQSTWGLVLLGIILYVGTTAGVIYKHRKELFVARVPERVAVEAPPVLWSFKFQEIENLFDDLKAQRKRLEERELELEKAGAQLASEKKELAQMRSEIEALRKEISDTIIEIQEREYKNLKSLAQTYSNVSPQAAVTIFSEMDEAMAVKILSLMKADKVGAIFQEMAKNAAKDAELAKRAVRLSDRLRLLKPLQKESSQL